MSCSRGANARIGFALGRPIAVLAIFTGIAAALIWANLARGALPLDRAHLTSPTALLGPAEMVLRYSYLPRLAVSALAGAGLGIASFVLQSLLRNPLADPASLGIAAGASLTMTIVSLWAPSMMALGQEWVAIAGGMTAFLLVLLIAGRTLSPVRLISAGLVISLLCGSAGAVLTLFHRDFLQNVFVWSSGSLNQNSWDTARYLLPRIAAAAALACAFNRPLFILSLGDEGARNLGLPITAIRGIGLVIAVVLSSSIVSAVGIIGFVGMAAPIIARVLDFRRPAGRLLVSALIGALILVIADQTVQCLADLGSEIPTGAMTAAIGAPLLMILLPRLRDASTGSLSGNAGETGARAQSPRLVLIGLAMLLSVIMVAVFFLVRNQHGWHWAAMTEIERYLPWRWPRTLGALCAGAMLGTAGAALQRVTLNPMASPEILGITSGASLGVITLVFFGTRDLSSFATFVAASAGAGLTLLGMLALGRRSSFSPQHTLLLGIASGTALTALSTILMSSGDPRFGFLLAWMAGSTYGITGDRAMLAALAAVLMLPLAILLHRWIAILGLGEAVSRQVGITLARARGTILLLTAMLTAASVLLMGPLSFVGLLGPHLAISLGLRRPVHQLAGGMMIGAIVMVTADWLGRNLIFPYQIPAGLLAALVGGPYFLLLHARSRR